MRHDRKRNHSRLRATSFSNNPNRYKLAISFQDKEGEHQDPTIQGDDGTAAGGTSVGLLKKKAKVQRSEMSGSAYESAFSFDGMIPNDAPSRNRVPRERPTLPALPCGTATDLAQRLINNASSPVHGDDHGRNMLHSKHMTFDSATETDEVHGVVRDPCLQDGYANKQTNHRRSSRELSLQQPGHSESQNSFGIDVAVATGDIPAEKNGPSFDMSLESSPIIDFDNVDLFHCDEEDEIAQNGERPSEDVTFADVRTLSRRMRSILTWEKMLGFSSIAGATKFTAMQYKILSIALRTANPDVRLFTYKTLRSTMKVTLAGHCYPKSLVTELERTKGHATGRGDDVRPSTEVRLVLPSEWAKLDVATYPFYADVFENADRSRPDFLSIEDAPIVQQRAISMGKELRVWAAYDNVIYPTHIGDVIKIPCSKRGTFESYRYGWPVESIERSCEVLVKGIVGPLWCVSCAGSTEEVPQIDEMSNLETVVYRMFGRSTIPDLSPAILKKSATTDVRNRISQSVLTRDGTTSHVHCLPGDVCVIIRPCRNITEQSSEVVCLLIGSSLRSSVGLSAERLVWIRVAGGESAGCFQMNEEASYNVTKIPMWVSGDRSRPERPYQRHRQNSGVLDNGERFVLYRMILYADGFNQHKSLSDGRSVGGCYMLPLGLSVENRRSISAVRVISITPSGENMNDALHMVKEDIVTACTKGISGTDPYGRNVRIFVDLVGCFGDFPALSSMMDVKGHTADACCTLCTFSKRKKSMEPEILYSVEIHSRRLGYMRFDDRMEQLRLFGHDEAMKKRIGVRCDNVTDANAVLGISLGKKLKDGSKSVPEYHGRPVLDAMFDSSLSTAAAPDHMFTGLIKNVLCLCFEEVCTDDLRGRIEIQILDNLRRNSLPVTGHLFKKDKDNGFRGLHGHSMSALFCILLCSAPVFNQQYNRTNKKVFELPRLLQEFVAMVYGCFSSVTDGTANKVNEQHRYESNLAVAGRKYLQAAADVCSELGQKGAVLDKPNAHRALELCFHTIPNYGHARNCSEMVLEMMHRTFKQWLETNTNADAHITAVERALTRDWLGRIYSLYECWSTADKKERACAEVGLRRLILGEESVVLDESEPEVATFLNDFRACLRLAMREPVLSQLQFNGNSHVTWNISCSWEVAKPLLYDQRPEHADVFINLVSKEYDVYSGAVKSRFKFFKMMRLVATSKYGRRKRAYPHNTVQVGDGISAVVYSRGPVRSTILTAEDGRGSLEMFSVHGVIQGDDKKVWAVVKKFIPADIGMTCNNVPYQILAVSKCVRRIGLMHICDDRCLECTRSETMKHSSSAVDGGKYFLYSRTDGYPPYMG